MPLSMQQVQKLQQRLIMTPQMQQSVKLLQMNTLELEHTAQMELLENPFLEMEEEAPLLDADALAIVNDGNEEASPLHDRAAPDPADDFDGDEAPASPEAPTDGDAAASPEESLSADLEARPLENQPENFAEVDTDWSEVFDDHETRSFSTPNEDLDDRSFEETVAGRTSLYEMLARQLRVSALEGLDAEIGAYLVGSINEDGYLKLPLEECAARFECTVERVERVLAVIQEFDPTGVGARDLPECLCLQLGEAGQVNALARRMLQECWPLLVKKRFREIARHLDITEEEVQRLFERIRRLDPTPGHAFTREQPIYIVPDVYVRKIGDRYETFLHEGQIAHLRLNGTYREILIRGKTPGQDPKEREYALERYRSAVMFIKNIERRRNTVLRVTECIMEYQREFLEKGVQALRPLALSDIAQEVHMHEATISRVTSNKYVDTPQGLYELKFFFSSRIESGSGEGVSSRAIKQKIQEMIDAENPVKPLSDDRIAGHLKSEGFTIARRTVAKYREQLHILPTNLRRKNH